MPQASFIELYPDTIDILTTLTAEIVQNPQLRTKYLNDISEWDVYVNDMLEGADKVLRHSASSSKTFFTILSDIAINYIEDEKKSAATIEKIIAFATVQDASTSMLRLDILINLLNMVDVRVAPKLHVRLFLTIIKYAIETENHRRIVFPAEEVINIVTEYSNIKLPKGQTGEVLSLEERISILLSFATVYEKMNRRSDAHHIYQAYVNFAQSVDTNNLNRVLANFVKSATYSEIEALKSHKIIASHENASKLLDAILAQNVETYMNFYNENKGFVDSIQILTHDDILKTVRIFSLAKLFSTSDKTTFTYEEILPVLHLGEAAGNREVEMWIIKGVEAKAFTAQLNPKAKSVFVPFVAFSKPNETIVRELKTKLEKVGKCVAKSVEKVTPKPDKAHSIPNWVHQFEKHVPQRPLA